jgi:hypothetical protein
MGGLLTRLFATTDEYYRPDNLNKGDVHRLITLDTPHFGTSFANLLVALHSVDPVDTENTVGNVVPLTPPEPPASVINGAVCDLAENSSALSTLSGGTGIASLVIEATGGPAVGTGPTVSGVPTALFWGGVLGFNSFEAALTASRCAQSTLDTTCMLYEPVFPQGTVNSFRFREANDAIVPSSSQINAGPNLGGASSGPIFPKLIHFAIPWYASLLQQGVTKTGAVATEAFQLLDGTSGGFTFASLQGVSSDGTGSPLTVPGQGGNVDKQAYATQCTPGGPMKPLTSSTLASSSEHPNTVAAQVPRATAHIVVDPRVNIVSPGAGSTFAPGDIIPISVQVTPPLTANDTAVYVAGFTQLHGSNYVGDSYEASFSIPPLYAGPLTFTPAITNASNALITGAAVTVAVTPTTPPTRLVLAQHSYRTTLPTNVPDHIYVNGFYPNGDEFDLTSSASGTTYQSSNTKVVTVDSNGAIQYPGQAGSAIVAATNRGVSDYADFIVQNQASAPAPQDLTSQVSVQMSGFQLNRTTGFYVQTVTVTNSTSVPISGPLYFVAEGLPTGTSAITMTNPTGYTQTIQPMNSPYLAIPINNGLAFEPGETHSFQLQFLNPSRIRISYTAKVFTTTANP